MARKAVRIEKIIEVLRKVEVLAAKATQWQRPAGKRALPSTPTTGGARLMVALLWSCFGEGESGLLLTA